MDEDSFVRWSHQAVAEHGFSSSNTIACVGVCRDELCNSLVKAVRYDWGEAFNFSGLAGMPSLGTTGFAAAQVHAPNTDGRQRYVYFVMPHIGITKKGEPGNHVRIGQNHPSPACGALQAIRRELLSGGLDLEFNPDDAEYSLLKQQLAPRLQADVPDIATLTLLTSELVSDYLERMIERTVDTDRADYAVLTGVQIHRPQSGSMIWPNRRYAMVRGERHALDI